jgi:hypothetical protein
MPEELGNVFIDAHPATGRTAQLPKSSRDLDHLCTLITEVPQGLTQCPLEFFEGVVEILSDDSARKVVESSYPMA